MSHPCPVCYRNYMTFVQYLVRSLSLPKHAELITINNNIVFCEINTFLSLHIILGSKRNI